MQARSEYQAMVQTKAAEMEREKQLQEQKAEVERELQRRQRAESERQAQFRARRNRASSPTYGAFAPGFNLPGVTSPAQSTNAMSNDMTLGGGRGRGVGRGRGGGRGRHRNSGPLVTPQQTQTDAYMSDSEVGSITTVLEEEEGWNQTGDQAARDALAAKFGNTTPDASGGVGHP